MKDCYAFMFYIFTHGPLFILSFFALSLTLDIKRSTDVMLGSVRIATDLFLLFRSCLILCI